MQKNMEIIVVIGKWVKNTEVTRAIKSKDLLNIKAEMFSVGQNVTTIG
jgi:hypothetical protein